MHSFEKRLWKIFLVLFLVVKGKANVFSWYTAQDRLKKMLLEGGLTSLGRLKTYIHLFTNVSIKCFTYQKIPLFIKILNHFLIVHGNTLQTGFRWTWSLLFFLDTFVGRIVRVWVISSLNSILSYEELQLGYLHLRIELFPLSNIGEILLFYLLELQRGQVHDY